ncbi:calcium:proton antiporter [Myroides albus]|uniref:Calcium:proton antiporter n=1 Tax=Myroides albus TaxID=2562892 RepID=A0A6I3LP36_9FLAO|nr:calcium:proton antiporter [Myroides albus]MTG99186.1 calcium:proton antiporter [Myroides albus]UVD79881.1 calcium:proton antiporter [Myroides albus]
MKNANSTSIFPTKTKVRLATIWLIVFIFLFYGNTITGESLTPWLASTLFLVLLFTIVGAAFGVVKEADELAHKLGEPYGTLILTLSIVSIEVILISAVMLGPGENPTIGKDSIFSVMMIIMNLVIGLCILLGGLKYGEQEYNAQGTMSYIAMIIMLGGIGLMLPNFIQGAGGGRFSDTQAILLALFIIFLYGIFLFFQMKGYKHLYVQPKTGSMEILYKDRLLQEQNQATEVISEKTTTKANKEIWLRSIILLGMILPIVLLSHNMAVVVDYGIQSANLPTLLGGVLVAIIVFTPESMTAVKAALNNEFQRAINLCHGAFVSTVGLTVPSVLIVGLITGKTVLFGMNSTETILFVITLLLSLMTFLGKRTTPIMGVMHLVLFAVFAMLIFNP